MRFDKIVMFVLMLLLVPMFTAGCSGDEPTTSEKIEDLQMEIAEAKKRLKVEQKLQDAADKAASDLITEDSQSGLDEAYHNRAMKRAATKMREVLAEELEKAYAAQEKDRAEKEKARAEKEKVLAEKERARAERDSETKELEKQLRELQDQIDKAKAGPIKVAEATGDSGSQPTK